MSICVNFKAPSTIPKAYFSKKTGINKNYFNAAHSGRKSPV